MGQKQSDSYNNRYSYIPPAAQKSMAQHMDRTLPTHLKQYQQGGYIPKHAEKAMAEHMQKNLPSHLKQYADPYLQQNIVWSNQTKPSPVTSATSSPVSRSVNPRVPRQSRTASINDQSSQPPAPANQQGNPGGGDYDFIMNPQKPPKSPLFFVPASTTKRIMLAAGGLIALLMIMVVGSSFLNSANNAQNDKLLELAKTQTEIVRVSELASEKISDKNLLYQSVTVKASINSSKNEVVTALSKRGKKVKDKDLNSGENADNDEILSEGEQNGRYDNTYRQLLEQQLADYKKQLESVYDSGNSSEKDIMVSANNQIPLLLNEQSASQ